jgi:hypothetical protein
MAARGGIIPCLPEKWGEKFREITNAYPILDPLKWQW